MKTHLHFIPDMRYYFILSLVFFYSYCSGQIEAALNFNSDRRDSEQVIHITWSEEEESKWILENKDRLDIMALKTSLESSVLPLSGENITRYTFALMKSSPVEILMQVDHLEAGEQLALINKSTGREFFSFNGSPTGKQLSPAFDPRSTQFVWRGSEHGYKSIFNIKTLYKHKTIDERGSPIRFGTSLTCHLNVSCKQDSIIKLISGSAMRIRMVMDEGIGWCRGSFINNTRNDKTPYILLAYHCTFEYTPQYDLWRFDLEYTSDSCTNPLNEPLIFSITGCEKKAGGQASDFLLVQLNEFVPDNHQVTFAGWNRDDTVTPDTSYMIHHPNADIRKISTSVNKAVIHPSQIGWSEGYTTPANHHFRFKFTEGGHQPGSSGAPVFNQDGYLIGQLHGGTMGCEATNNAYTGRISKSWLLGSTAQERLKEWLDPDGMDVIQWPSITNLSEGELGDIHGSIKDPNGVAMENVEIRISGSVNDTLVTDAEGRFRLNSVNRNGQYQIVPLKNTNQTNGVNVVDLLSIQRHLLGKDTFDFPWQYIAGDATNNNVVSVGDILLLMRLLLGKITFLPSSNSWRFFPSSVEVTSIPSGGPLEINIQAVKIGDVNGSADPKL